MPINWWGRQNAAPRKLDPQPSEAAFSAVLRTCRSEVAGDVISCVAVDYVDMDVWPAGPVLRITFAQYLITFCSRPEATSDVISGRVLGPVILDNPVKSADPRISISR